jgi:hypothetical protein
MFDILSIIPGKKKTTSSGWHSFNAICCGHLGHKPDRRMRGGIKFDGQTNWSMHCFNCGYKCNFVLGRSISYKTKQLLLWCGIDDTQIGKWSLESLQQKDLLEIVIQKKTKIKIKFKDHELPEGEMLDENNPLHNVYVDYVQSRGINHNEYPFLITPNLKGRYANRIIIPYTYKNKIVGHTSRFLDNKIPKYINEQQPGYVFNIDIQKPEWQVCILTEGIFDALSIDGIAIMHDDISNEQAQLIASLNKQIIVVPDRDKTGLKLCDRALELGYSVSLPNWETDIKDVNDAVVRYGKLPTLLSILQSATMSKIKIEIQRKKIEKTIG